jgi:3-hydroxybutyryl-CoA dehydrogenase/5-formyl-3-hydroxy-2-methylpyridine 4-carboxylate dehydrogenase
LQVKEQVYRALDALLPADTIVASDTSGLPITKLQAFMSNPARVVGMHWSNPPHIIPMIEVIAGEKTAPQTVDFIVRTIRELNLLPVVVKKDVPGFVENRVLYALLREAVSLVESGVIDPEDLDTCVSWGIGYKLGIVGPMALLDMAGLDIYESVSSFLNAELSTRSDVAPFVRERTGAGQLGIKSGRGVYTYTPERAAALQAERASLFVAVRKALEGRP